mgnify:CR=1 FL=1
MPLGKNGYFYPTVQIPTVSSTKTELLFISGFMYTCGEELSQNDTVYLNNNGKIYRTNIFSISSSFVIGFCEKNAITDSEVFIFSAGQTINNFSGLSTGSRYFLSQSFGKISTIPPNEKNTTIYQVGIAKSTTELIFLPQPLIIN